MAGPGNILIRVGAEAGQAVRELGTVDKALGSTMTTSEKMSAGVKKAALPAAAALGAIGYAAIGATKAAMEDAAAQEHLSGVLKRTTGATTAQVKATEEWIGSVSRQTGVADDELRPALELLVTASGDVGKAQKDMQAALDISAASGKSVEEVSKAIALAHTGQTAKLEKLIPGLSQASKKSDDMNTIMGELATTTGGAMAASTETAAGQMKVMQNQTNELQESLGMALLPVIEALLPLFVSFADFASENTTAIKILILAVAGLSAGILIANAAMKAYAAASAIVKAATAAWTAVQWLLNAALNANPIGLIIIALAALAAGIYLAWTRSQTFRNIVTGAFDAVKDAVQAVDRAFDALLNAARSAFNWVTDHWKLALFAFGPIGAAVYLIATNFDRIKSAATDAFNTIKNGVQPVIDAIQRLLEWLGKIKVPKIGGTRLPGPLMVAPSFATPGAAGPGTMSSGARAASGPGALTINVYGAVDPEGTARAIRRVLDRSDRRQGRTI